MVSHKLIEQPFNEELKSDTLDHITEYYQVFTLANHWNVVFLYWWSFWQASRENIINPEKVVSFFACPFVAELAMPIKLFDSKFFGRCIKLVLGGIFESCVTNINSGYCSDTNK